jgi:hypothetical protein
MGGVLGWGQKLLTETGQAAIGVGPGLYTVGGGMIHDPVGTTAKLATQFGKSLGQTIEHPIRQLKEDPLGFITNVLIPVGATAGTAARVSEFADTARALRAGEITNMQAVGKIGKTLMRPQPMQRNIQVTPDTPEATGLRVSPPAFKSALGGYLQTKVLDPLTERAIKAGKLSGTKDKLVSLGREFKVPEQMRGALPEGHVGKLMRQDIEQQMQMRRGLEEVKQAKLMGEGTTTMYHGGPQNLEGGVLDAGRTHPGNYFGGGAYATDSPEVAKAYSLTHDEPFVHKLEVYSKSLANADTPMTKEMLKAIEPHMGPLPKGTTLRQVFDDLNNRASQGYHDLTKPVGQTPSDVLPGHIQKALSGIGIHGIHYKAITEPGDLKSLAAITGRAGKDLKAALGKVGRSREAVIWNPEEALHDGPPQLSAGEAQKRAYAIGAAKTHMDVWKSLHDGGAGYAESFAHDPHGYVAIRKPPDEVKWKGYSSEAAIGKKFADMVETDPAKVTADPHAFTFIPRGTWQRMKLFQPGTGPLAKTADVIDRGTQMIRIGRFLHPGYAAWAAQNGILHLTQAGMFGFRNAWQLRNEFPRMTDEEKAVFDNAVGAGHFGGGIARASAGSETSKFSGLSKSLAGFWHKVDDRYWRRMSLIHELNHQGYHSAEDWANLMRTDNPEFRKIGRLSQKEAIDYSEMSPSERATFQKMFTAWGWTRGASTYTMRYPLQHPVQFQALAQVAKQGEKQVNNFYSGKNGMAPSWLRGYLPLGHGNAPFMLGGSTINPGETFGNLLAEIPGATKGQTESLAQEEAPVPASLQEMLTGMTRYGQALKGNKRIEQPLTDLAHRFTPYSTIQNLLANKKGGGTFAQGPEAAAAQFLGAPLEKLNNAKQVAALGMKDYEQSLSTPDEINFRYHTSVQRLAGEAQLFHSRTGSQLTPALMGKIKGDLDAVHTRDLFQYQYAQAHGSKSYRSLPPINKIQGAIQFMTEHKYISTAEASQVLATASKIKDDTAIESLANELWSDTGIGDVANQWKSSMKDLQKPTLTPARP